MLIPSIDLMGGKIVQLVQGEKRALDFSDFEPWIKKFEKYPMVQVVDLDAAMRQGSNREIVNLLCKRLHCQVGGGISTVEIAKEVLDAGAMKVIIGSALFDGNQVNTEFAAKLASEIGVKKLVFSVDAKGGKIAVSGWKISLAITAVDAIKELEPYCSAFLYTNIDTEGMLVGFPPMTARELRAATKKQLILSGGIRSLDEVAEFDAMDADAVVGMAIYSGVMEA
ncbi:MAG TPA: HisA/HisF-related TIM barrel protein [Terriglobales bacterium]|nr:HisA/HisF-related TIM barrel protein [Terriglobales bacterium]